MRAFALAVLAALGGCALVRPGEPNADEGEGARLVATVCAQCHNLGGLEAFKGYWDRDQWRDLVVTMVDHGAELDDRQIDVVAEHLTARYGPR